MRITMVHPTKSFSFKASLCVAKLDAYRFLMGRDLLVPLKYEVSETGLKLTNPKTDVSTLFVYSSDSVQLCTFDDDDDVLTTATVLLPQY